MVRRIKRNTRKVLKSKLKKIALSSSLVLALSISMAGGTLAQGVISNNLPVPNYIDGATFKYNNSSNTIIQAGNVNQQAAKAVADSSNRLDIGVNKNVADLKYNSYNIAKNRVVNYNFSSPWQVALNRVTQANPSFIHGNITGANGKVFLINPNGILFGANSAVNVGGFMASTHNYKGKAADLLSGKIELARDSVKPTGIFLDKGAVINAPKGIALSANAIAHMGSRINAGHSTAQLITGDGVHFSFSSEIWPVSPDDVKATQSTTDYVQHPYVQTMPGVYQVGKTNTIDANNITIVSKVNTTLNHPFLQLVNLEGLNTAKALSTKAGKVFIHSENINSGGQAGGIYVKNSIKAYGRGGEICLKADKLDLKSNIYSETISLTPSAPNMEILLGEGTAVNQKHFAVLYDNLKYLNAQNVNIGNDTNSYVHGAMNMAIPDSASVNLTLKTRGDVEFDIGRNYPTSMLNFTRPNSVLLTGTAPGVKITTGDIVATDSIVIIVTDEDIVTGDLCASVGDNQTIDELIKLEVIGTGDISTQNITATVGNSNTVNNDLVSLITENGDIQTENINLNIGSMNTFSQNILNINSSGADFGNITTDDIKVNLQDKNLLSNTDTNIASFEADGNITTNNIEFNTGDNNEFSDGMDLESKKKLDIAKLSLNIGNDNLIIDEVIDIDGDTKLTVSDMDIKLCDGNTVGDNIIDAESSQGDIDTGNININIGKGNIINNILEAETEGDEANITTCDINVNIDSKNIIQDNAIDINTLGDTADITTCDIKINLQNENKLNASGRDVLLFVTNSNINTNNVEFNIGDKNEFNDGFNLIGRKEINTAKINSKIGSYNLITGEIIDIVGSEKFTTSDVDIKICDGNIVSEDVIDFSSTNINTENINIKIGKDNIINDVIEIDTNNLGNFIAKNIIVNSESDGFIQIVASGDINACKIVSDAQRNSNIELFSQNNVTTGDLCANNEVIIAGEQPPDIEDGKEKDIKAGDPLVKANEVCVGNITAENLHIAANSITTGNINASGFVMLEDDVAINVGDITSSGPITLTTTNGDIVTGNLCATLGNEQTIDELILLVAANSGNITTKNITAKIDNGNIINNRVVSLISNSGNVTTKNVNINIASSNDITNNVLLIQTSGNITTCDINTCLNFKNSVTSSSLMALISSGAGNIQAGNFIADIGSSNSTQNVVLLNSSGGDILTENIHAGLDSGNDINGFLIGLSTDEGNITTKSITLEANASNTFNNNIINMRIAGSITTSDINAELNNQNTLNNNLIDIFSNSKVTTNNISVDISNNNTIQSDVVLIDTSASFTAQNIDVKLNNRNTVHGDVVHVFSNIDTLTRDIKINICEDNTIGGEVVELLNNDNTTTKNINVYIGDNSTVVSNIIDINSFASSVETCDIEVISDNKGRVNISAEENITTGKIISDASLASDIELFAPGDITTNELFANGNITIVKTINAPHIDPDKANVLTINGDITAIDLTIAANSITTGNINITGTLDLIDDIGISVGDITTAGPIIITTAQGDIITGNLTATIGDDQTIDNLILLETAIYGDITTGTINACAGSYNTINGDVVSLVTQDGDISTKDIKVKLDSGNEIAGHVLELTAGGKIDDCNITTEIGDSNLLADGFDIVKLSATEDITRSNITVTAGDLNKFDSAISIDSGQDIKTDNIKVEIGNNNSINSDMVFLNSLDDMTTSDININLGVLNNVAGNLLYIQGGGAPIDITTKNICVHIDESNTLAKDVIYARLNGTLKTKNINVDIENNSTVADKVIEIGAFEFGNVKTCEILVNSQTDGFIAIAAGETITTDKITSNGQTTSNIELFASPVGVITTKDLCANDDIKTSQQNGINKVDEVIVDGNIKADNLDIIANSITTGNINATGSVNLADDVVINVGDITAGGPITLTSLSGDIITGNLTTTIGDDNVFDDLILLEVTDTGDICTKNITAKTGSNNQFGITFFGNGFITLKTANGSVKACNINAELEDGNSLSSIDKDIVQIVATNQIKTNDINVKINDDNTIDRAIRLNSSSGDLTTCSLSVNLNDNNRINNDLVNIKSQNNSVTTKNINIKLGDDNIATSIGGNDVFQILTGSEVNTQDICIDIGNNNVIDGNIVELDAESDITAKNIKADIGSNTTVNNEAISIHALSGDIETCDIEVKSQTNGGIEVETGESITIGKIISNTQATSDIELFTPGNVAAKELSANGDIQISRNDETNKAAEVVVDGDITADNLEIIANSITTGNINTTGSMSLMDDVAINVGDITAGGPIILISTGGDIITGNLISTIEDFQSLDNLILLQATGDGNICTKNITAEVGSNNTFNDNVISLTSENGTIKTCDISASLVSDNRLFFDVIDINSNSDIIINNISVDLRNNYIEYVTKVNSANGNVKIANIDMNLGVPDFNTISNTIRQDALSIDAGKGIETKNIYIELGDDSQLGGDVIDLDANEDIITENIKIDTINNRSARNSVDIKSVTGSVTTSDIEVNSKERGYIFIEAFKDITTGNLTGTSGDYNIYSSDNVIYLHVTGDGNICTKNITATVGNNKTFSGSIIGLSAENGNVSSCDITAKVGNYVDMKHVIDINAKNNIEVQNFGINIGTFSDPDSNTLNITTDSGIKAKDITMYLGDNTDNDTTIGQDIVNLEAGEDIIIENIELDIVGYAAKEKAVDIISTSGEVRACNIKADGKFTGLIYIEAFKDITIDNLTSNSPFPQYFINIDHTDHAVYLHTTGNGNITTKNITANVGEANTFNKDIISLNAENGNVKTCDIELNSKSVGNIAIYAENIITENISSKSSSGNGIELFTSGDITTKELSANGDTLISQSDLTSKADIVNTSDITADNLNIIANDITVGDLNVNQNIDLQDDLSIITGKIFAGGTVNITASDGCIEVNSINAGEVNLFGNEVSANGNITTSGNFNASKDGSEKAEKICVQNVTATGDLTIIADEIDFNNVNAGGNLDIIDDSYIKGYSAIAGGNILLVSPENNIDIKTIKGNKIIFSEFRF